MLARRAPDWLGLNAARCAAIATLATSVALLTGCGSKGDLVLPTASGGPPPAARRDQPRTPIPIQPAPSSTPSIPPETAPNTTPKQP